MSILLLCIPGAILVGILWGVAIEKHRAAKRRDKRNAALFTPNYARQPDEPKRRSF